MFKPSETKFYAPKFLSFEYGNYFHNINRSLFRTQLLCKLVSYNMFMFNFMSISHHTEWTVETDMMKLHRFIMTI